MKQLLQITLIISLFCACSLQSQNKSVEGDGITSDNFVRQVTDSIKRYPQEPLYYMFATNSNCYYEILVNDFPVYRHFGKGILATPIWINMGILKSGEQKLTYRMYPKDDVFPNTTDLEIDLRVMDDRIGFDSEQDILKHRSAYNVVMLGTDKDIKREVFAAAGQKYYEHTITFNATVPYQNQGWLDGQDLRKFDQDSLYQAVRNYYNSYKKIYDNKDANRLAQVYFRSILMSSQAEYDKEEKLQKIWDEYLSSLNVDKEFVPMDNIKMSFYGDGRMVCLEQANIEDLRFRGQSAFYYKYKKGKNTYGESMGIYLYLPKGKKNLSDLEMAI